MNDLTLKLKFCAYGEFSGGLSLREKQFAICSRSCSLVEGIEAFHEEIIANFAVFVVVVGDFAVLRVVSCAHHQ